MKVQLIVAAGFVALATGASAQVVDTTAIMDPFANANARFLSVGENLAEIDGSVNIEIGGANGSTNETTSNGLTTLEATATETTAAFGNISTTAAGALSNTTTNLTETAAMFEASADAATSNTSSAADDMMSMGGGIGVSTGAFNGDLATIDGSITVGVNFGSTDFGDLSTTAAGAINTANITAAFVALATTN